MNKVSLPCSCGDCGDWQIMYQPLTSSGPDRNGYAISYRCRNCGREYQSIEEILDIQRVVEL